MIPPKQIVQVAHDLLTTMNAKQEISSKLRLVQCGHIVSTMALSP